MSESNTERLQGLHPAFLLRVWAFLGMLGEMGVSVRVLFGYRTAEHQARLRLAWEAGKGGKAAKPWLSWHQYGFAMDALPYDDEDHDGVLDSSELDWKTHLWTAYRDAAHQMGFVWGGNFRSVDKPHVEWHPGFSKQIRLSQIPKLQALYAHRNYYGKWSGIHPQDVQP